MNTLENVHKSVLQRIRQIQKGYCGGRFISHVKTFFKRSIHCWDSLAWGWAQLCTRVPKPSSDPVVFSSLQRGPQPPNASMVTALWSLGPAEAIISTSMSQLRRAWHGFCCALVEDLELKPGFPSLVISVLSIIITHNNNNNDVDRAPSNNKALSQCCIRQI